MKGPNKLPDIPEKDTSPTVKVLLEFIDQQNALILQQAEEIQQLKDEIAWLKNQPQRPKIKYRLKVYETPDGGYVIGKLPEHLNDKHFGSMVIGFIL